MVPAGEDETTEARSAEGATETPVQGVDVAVAVGLALAEALVDAALVEAVGVLDAVGLLEAVLVEAVGLLDAVLLDELAEVGAELLAVADGDEVVGVGDGCRRHETDSTGRPFHACVE